MPKSQKDRIESFKNFLEYRRNELESAIKDITFSEALKNQYIGAIREIEIVQQVMSYDKI